MNVDVVTEKVLKCFTSEKFTEELQHAKREFFEMAGIVDEENHQFEPRMAQFLDWYIFSRELLSHNLSPIRYALESNEFSDDLQVNELEKLSQTKHSLFEFLKTKGNDVYVRDLFTKKKVILEDSEISIGFNPDEIFDARIIPFEGSFVFARGFCFHPPGAKKFILKEVKKIRHLDNSHHEALMLRLLKMRYKLEQYKHIRMEFIYTNDPKMKI
ncbi:MAG: hypothetical protein AB8E15_09215 [Bdellovibrionales bacterium]